MIRVKENILDVLFPPRCPICEKILKVNNNQVCKECRKEIRYIQEPACKKCGKMLLCEEQEYCYDCNKQEHIFIRGLSLWIYDKNIKKSLYRFKYNNKQEYAKIYANEIMMHHGRQMKGWNVDAIIPIPLHKSKLRSRGFNQAEILAKELSKLLVIPCYNNYVMRSKKTLPQKSLNDKQRKNNLKNAFKIGVNDVKLNKVILIDDIYTTGITVDSVTEVLNYAGVNEVYVITVGIGEGL